MNGFILATARFIESKDSSLVPVCVEKITYPDLNVNEASESQYAEYHSSTPTAPPPDTPSRRPQTRSQTPSGPSHVTHVTNHYHTRHESSFYRKPTPSVFFYGFQQPVVNRTIIVKSESKEEEKSSASPWLGAAVLVGTTVATTVAVSKLALERREFEELLDQRKNVKLALISEDEESFINQFDLTFAELRKSRNILTGSALSGGGSLALLGSMLFMGANNDITSAVAIFSGCGAVAGACYAYFFVSDDRNTRCKKLHALAKKIIEKNV